MCPVTINSSPPASVGATFATIMDIPYAPVRKSVSSWTIPAQTAEPERTTPKTMEALAITGPELFLSLITSLLQQPRRCLLTDGYTNSALN
jgi:hypothetical protein